MKSNCPDCNNGWCAYHGYQSPMVERALDYLLMAAAFVSGVTGRMVTFMRTNPWPLRIFGLCAALAMLIYAAVKFAPQISGYR